MIDVEHTFAGGCPSALELAAYIDSRVDDAQRDDIEGHLAACSSCLEAVAETRGLVIEPAPRRVVERATALAGRVAAPWGRWARASRAAAWPFAAAASIAVCLVGYRVGAGAFAAPETGDAYLVEMTFGVFGAADPEWLADEFLPAGTVVEDAP